LFIFKNDKDEEKLEQRRTGSTLLAIKERCGNARRVDSVTKTDLIFLLCLILISSWKILIATHFKSFYGIKYPGTVDVLAEAAKILGYSDTFPVGGTTTFFLLPYILTLLLRLSITGKTPLYLCIFSNLACGLTVYLLASEMYGKKVAFISGLLVLSNWHFWWWSNVLLADVPNLLLMVVSTYLFYRGTRRGSKLNLWYSAVFLALAVLTKYSSIVLIVLFIVDRLVNRRCWQKGLWGKEFVAILFFTSTLTCWGLYNLRLGRMFFGPIIENIGMNAPRELHLKSFLILGIFRLKYHLVDGGFPLVFSLPCTILSILGFAYHLVKEKNSRDREYFLLIWMLAFLFAFSFGVKYTYERYALHWTVPVLIGSSLGIVRIEEKIPRGMKICAYALAAFCILSTNNTYPLPFLDIYPSIAQRSLVLAHERILRYTNNLEDPAYRHSYKILREYARLQGFNWNDFLLLSSLLFPAIYYACTISYSRFLHHPTSTIEEERMQTTKQEKVN